MFLAILCSSSRGQNCILRHLVSSLSVSGRAVHFEVFNVIHILQNKGIVHQVGNKNKFRGIQVQHTKLSTDLPNCSTLDIGVLGFFGIV
jgi:hypothetical protein